MLCDCVWCVCVGRLWPAVIYSELLPVRMPSGHCLCVLWVLACVRVCVCARVSLCMFPVRAVMSITQTRKYTTVNHFEHLSVSIQMNNLQWSAEGKKKKKKKVEAWRYIFVRYTVAVLCGGLLKCWALCAVVLYFFNVIPAVMDISHVK